MIFPNIPNVPGVPAIPRLPGVAGAVVDLLTSDLIALFGGSEGPVWGLFMDNAPVIVAESVLSFDFKKGAKIASFPIEQGGFESYNKVQQPFDVRIRFTTGGTLADRQAFLASVDEACSSLDLMDAVTPEAIYTSVNPLYYDYRRTAERGVTLLQVDVFCEEVRVRSSSSFTTVNAAGGAASTSSTSTSSGTSFNDRFPTTAQIVQPAAPSASPMVNGGTVQPIPATTAQQNAIDTLMIGAP